MPQPRRPSGPRRASAALLCLCACAAPTVRADETKVFEWRDASGMVSYSQQSPPPGTQGVTSREVETRSFTPAQRIAIKAQLAGLQIQTRADAKRFEDRVAAADEAVHAALQRLSLAEDALRRARAPEPDERVGDAGGGTRLRGDYFARQLHLEDAAQEARARVEDAYRARRDIEP
jgi:hypothetical protein